MMNESKWFTVLERTASGWHPLELPNPLQLSPLKPERNHGNRGTGSKHIFRADNKTSPICFQSLPSLLPEPLSLAVPNLLPVSEAIKTSTVSVCSFCTAIMPQ